MYRVDQKYHQAMNLVETNEKLAQKSDCELVQLLLKKRRGDPLIANALLRALDIYEKNKPSRQILEALIIAPDSTDDRIASGIGIKKDVLTYYKKYFFDISGFEDELDVTDYISEIENDKEQVIKKMARTQGLNFILSHINGGELSLSPLELCKKVQSLSWRMIQQASFSAITSEAAKEAKGWMAIMKSYTDAIQKAQPIDTQSEFLAEFRVMFTKDDPIPDISKIEGEVVRG